MDSLERPAGARDVDADSNGNNEFGAIVYRMWPWMAWLLPVALFILIAVSGAGGWEMLFALLYSPLILPAYALLGLIPRRVMRKAGKKATSNIVGALLVLHWWSLIIFSIFVRGSGDSGSLDSVIGEILWWLPESVENTFSRIGALCALSSWLAVMVFSFITSSTLRRRFSLAWTSLVVPPVLVVLALSTLYAGNIFNAQDAAGNSQYSVKRLSVAETRELHNLRWDSLQEELVPLRGAIAGTGWIARKDAHRREGVVDSSGVNRAEDLIGYGSVSSGYTLGIVWEMQSEISLDEAITRAQEAAKRQGLKPISPVLPIDTGRGEDNVRIGQFMRFSDAQGNAFGIRIVQSEREYADLTMTARSPEYWREGAYETYWNSATTVDLDEVFGDRHLETGPKRFATDQWPELKVFRTG
ncbi:hypothetical protein [Arthrobacter sp. MYb227]|uniref:hypothetical protein n=1 Tax=Arthrobacter sp. MYb227 TaxID=1848601 RepID=UPI000CFC6557|nr:hypothetical protein [Arthrobacter sp. MYb227]